MIYRTEVKLLIGLTALFVFIWYYQNHNINNLLKSGSRTKCVVTDINSKNIKVVFTIKGQTYKNTLSNPCTCLYTGENYTLAYTPSNPKVSAILFWQPVFNKHRYAATIATEIQMLPGFWGNKSVLFEYIAGGNKYKRYQGLAPEKEDIQKYNSRVFYNTAHPEIAYIEY
jgi:hypothetical protein